MKKYVCVECRHKFVETFGWRIKEIEKREHIKICAKCVTFVVDALQDLFHESTRHLINVRIYLFEYF